MNFSRKHRRHGHVPAQPRAWPQGDTKTTLVTDLEEKPAEYMRDLLIKRARAGHYHDFESALDTPKMTLVKHLEHAGYFDLAQKVKDGAYDYEPPTDEQRAEMARWLDEKKEGGS